jgi:acyl homoserine lactone synthase
MYQIVVGREGDASLDIDTLKKMFIFRDKVFRVNLGWDVTSEDGQERDFYDSLRPFYMLARTKSNEVQSCWRLLPTTGPYMLKDTFPQLLAGEDAPQEPGVWEISRFAVTTVGHDERVQVTLNAITFSMIRSAFDFAQSLGIRRYIAVTSVALERLLRRIGLPVSRFAGLPAQRIGKVLTVACWIDINDQFREVVYSGRAAYTASQEAA